MASRLPKVRLDHLVAKKGLTESREKAKAMVMAGLVQVDGAVIDKPGRLVSTSTSITLTKPVTPITVTKHTIH